MEPTEHPDYPVDPETGRPAKTPEELQTGEERILVDGMDYGRVFTLKSDTDAEEVIFEDDSDDEAFSTWQRFQSK